MTTSVAVTIPALTPVAAPAGAPTAHLELLSLDPDTGDLTGQVHLTTGHVLHFTAGADMHSHRIQDPSLGATGGRHTDPDLSSVLPEGVDVAAYTDYVRALIDAARQVTASVFSQALAATARQVEMGLSAAA